MSLANKATSKQINSDPGCDDPGWVAGVDGCRRGWFRVSRELRSGAVVFDVVEGVLELVGRAPCPPVVAIDVPIGLSAAGPRECDRAARALLGARRSSVFPAPVRAAVSAETREQASRLTQRADGRRVGAQAWGIYAKVRDVDEALSASPRLRRVLREAHPEVSFRAWNDDQPMRHPKKTPEGHAERLALAEAWLGPGVLDRARGDYPKQDVADDDILDAIAVLWTAHRIADGSAQTLPGSAPSDETGLPMQIVF
jgi:predicted RNase H-like nuclease